MPTIIYQITFTHLDGSLEIQEHTVEAQAWESYRTFIEPDSFDIYAAIKLSAYNRNLQSEHILAETHFRPLING